MGVMPTGERQGNKKTGIGIFRLFLNLQLLLFCLKKLLAVSYYIMLKLLVISL